jgi:hypothetical protein
MLVKNKNKNISLPKSKNFLNLNKRLVTRYEYPSLDWAGLFADKLSASRQLTKIEKKVHIASKMVLLFLPLMRKDRYLKDLVALVVF